MDNNEIFEPGFMESFRVVLMDGTVCKGFKKAEYIKDGDIWVFESKDICYGGVGTMIIPGKNLLYMNTIGA